MSVPYDAALPYDADLPYGDPMAITLGIDVSSHQGTINWIQAAQTNFQFALTRMTIGQSTRDTQGRANLRGALDHMLVAGAYGVVGTAEPVEQGATLLVKEIAAVTDPARVLVMLDAEDFADGSHPTIAQVDRYAVELHRLLGRWPVAYVPGWWLGKYGYSVAGRQLANCPWAPSHYLPAPWTTTRLEANKPTSLRGFKSLAWLQYTDKAPCGGIAGLVDANCFYGPLDQLRAQLLGEETDMTQEEHDALMWLRQNVVLLRDQGVRMTDHGTLDTGKDNNLKQVRDDVAALAAKVDQGLTVVTFDPGQLTADQLLTLGKGLATTLIVEGMQVRDNRLVVTLAVA